MLAIWALIFGTSQAAPSCIQFTSGRVAVGQTYVAPLQRNLDFVLGDNRAGGWTINVMPKFDHAVDYLEIASPPYQVRPHLEVGRGYLSLAESLAFNRRVSHFVTNDVDRQRAVAAVTAFQRSQEHLVATFPTTNP